MRSHQAQRDIGRQRSVRVAPSARSGPASRTTVGLGVAIAVSLLVLIPVASHAQTGPAPQVESHSASMADVSGTASTYRRESGQHVLRAPRFDRQTVLARSLFSFWASSATVLVERLGQRLGSSPNGGSALLTNASRGVGTGLAQTSAVYSIGTAIGGSSGLPTLLGTAAGSAAGLSAMYAIVDQGTGGDGDLGLTLVGAGAAAIAPVLGFELAHFASRSLRIGENDGSSSLQIAPTANLDLEKQGGTVGVRISY